MPSPATQTQAFAGSAAAARNLLCTRAASGHSRIEEKTMSRTSAVAAALAVAFAAAPLLSAANDDRLSRDQTPTGEHVPVFDQIDSDGNGMLDKDEFARGTTAENVTFAEVDRNGDGKVSRQEWDEHKKLKKSQSRP